MAIDKDEIQRRCLLGADTGICQDSTMTFILTLMRDM